MTRFARAKGSKASNERVPENATSWSEMKNQLLEKSKQVEEARKKQDADKIRQKNYNDFLQQIDEDRAKNTQWAEFPSKKTKIGTNSAKNESGVKHKTIMKTKLKKALKHKADNLKIAGENYTKKNKRTSVKQKDNNLQIITGDKSDDKPKKMNGQKQVGKMKLKNKLQKKPDKEESNGKFVVKSKETLSEEDLKKIDKKKQKRIRQLEKKKLKKQMKTEINNVENKPEEKSHIPQNGVNTKTENNEQNLQKNKTPWQKDHSKTNNTPKFKSKETTVSSKINKQKLARIKDNKKHDRRKKPQEKMIINGKEVEIAYVDGFPIKKEDAARIQELRKQMISKGLPRSEIKIALKLERRRAEKAFAREKKKVCFNCRKSGHNLSECPDLGKELTESTGTGICFKCGSTEHTHFECKVVRGQEFKFAQCFICHEQGHIARQCPDNAKGLYPKGGACKVCGDVTHLKKDCPKYQAQQQQLQQSIQIETMNSNDNPDILSHSDDTSQTNQIKKSNKIIKF